MIFPLDRRSLHLRGFRGPLCTCHLLHIHVKCEHIFADRIDVEGVLEACRDFRNTPSQRPRGRTRGATATRRGTARAAAAKPLPKKETDN